MVSNVPIYPATIKDYQLALTSTNTTVAAALATGGTNGTRIDTLMASSTSNSAHDLQIIKNIGGTDTLLATISVPANAGTNSSTPNINLLNQIPGLETDANANPVMFLASGTILKMKLVVSLSASQTLAVAASGGDY